MRTRDLLATLAWTVLAASAGAGTGQAQTSPQGQSPQAIVEARCSTCHERQPDGTFKRIDHVRKTPEGWAMTLFRMNQIHGAKVTPEETQVLVRWFSDRQGLAPAETEPFRYVLERQPNVVEEPVTEGDLQTMCARCHSFARVGLQRRDADEWRRLAHFHLGQWPTTEYQALGRDRKWWEIASTEAPELLGKRFPFQTQEWSDWQKAPKPDLSGTWVVTGHRPGIGAYGGSATVTKSGDGYAVAYDLLDEAGAPLKGSGKSLVYTGYEWRGDAVIGRDEVREVYAASADGNRLSGRWFLPTQDEVGASFEAMRARPGTPMVAGVSRPHLRAGETARLVVWGSGLEGEVDLGPGIAATVVSRGPAGTVVEAAAQGSSAPGPRTVRVGRAEGPGPVVYVRLDAVKVEPPFAIARVGGNGGPLPPVTARFEAVGYLAGADGQPGTEDDVRVGPLPASWSLEPFNDAAAAMDDVRFSGGIDATGLFNPAGAGPNPARVYGTNNIGDLKVVAEVKDGERAVKGEGRLISTVQRWNDPPIR
jgi:quinohemoprotein amine dehydrogenase